MFVHVLAALAATLFVLSATSPALASDCGTEATLKSVPGGAATDIYFHNASSEQRRVYWLDENGQRKLKTIVESGQTQRQSTIAGHSWVVTDGKEKCLYVIVAASAPITAEIGDDQGPPPAADARKLRPPAADEPAGSTVARLGLSGWYQIRAVSKPGLALNNTEKGRPQIERVKDEWDSAYWQISDIPGSDYVTISSKWTQKNLAAAGDGLHTIVGAERGLGAQWTLESVDNGTYFLIKSRFMNRYLSATPDGFAFIDQPGAGNAGLWQLVRSTPPHAAGPTKKSRECPSGERFDPKRLDCVSIECGRHKVYSKSAGRCINKADTCSKKEVYSSSLAACIPKEQPKTAPKPKPPQPKAPPCAYKRDGVGNCLTPQFLACQKAYGACMKACGPKAGACEAKCHSKFAGTCGD